MHHDSRTYIEVRYDIGSADIVLVSFRDRGILPIQVMTKEFTLDAPEFTGDAQKELVVILEQLLQELSD